jgi:hypothetical protein
MKESILYNMIIAGWDFDGFLWILCDIHGSVLLPDRNPLLSDDEG